MSANTTTRGRPAHQMTPRRSQVKACISRHAEQGHLVSLSRIARECGLYSNSDVRRIVADLKAMGAI